MISDANLVTLAKTGDQSSFAELTRRHSAYLYTIALNLLHQHEDAEDAVQMALLSALKHLHQFREEAAFLTWVSHITIHSAFKLMNKRNRFKNVPLEDPYETDYADGNNFSLYMQDRTTEPVHIIEQHELQEILKGKIYSLPEKYKSVLELYEFEGLSILEISKYLHLSVSNVKVRLSRGRNLLKKKLMRTLGMGNQIKAENTFSAKNFPRRVSFKKEPS